MGLKELIDKLLGREERNPRDQARDRLRLVLMQDRSALPASVMEEIRKDIVKVLAKHCDVDESALDVNIERGGDGAVALTATIPIRNVRVPVPPAPAKPTQKKETGSPKRT